MIIQVNFQMMFILIIAMKSPYRHKNSAREKTIYILKFKNSKSQNIIHFNRVYVFQQLRCHHSSVAQTKAKDIN